MAVRGVPDYLGEEEGEARLAEYLLGVQDFEAGAVESQLRNLRTADYQKHVAPGTPPEPFETQPVELIPPCGLERASPTDSAGRAGGGRGRV